jgi:rod shape-determining protein MreB
MKKYIIGIDLGSSNTKIMVSNTDGLVFNEPTCIAIDTSNKEVKEIGYLANKIQGKAPYNYDVIYPVVNGIVSDDDALYLYLNTIFSQLHLNTERQFKNVALIFTAPSKCSKVNRKALIEIGKRLQVKEIYIESKAKLAAYGTGEKVKTPSATLICNIGAGLTDIACLSLGEIVASSSTFIAGDSFNEAIRRYMVQEQHLAIGRKTSEYIKMRIGTISPNVENKLVEVKGRDTITSLPSSTIISSSEIKKILTPLVKFIALQITDVISSIQPELAADLVKNGLILTGGSSLLVGLKEFLKDELSIPVRIADEPLDAVANGLKNMIDDINRE